MSVPTRVYPAVTACTMLGGGAAPSPLPIRRRTMRIGAPQQWHLSLGRSEVVAGTASAGTQGLRLSAIVRRNATPRRQFGCSKP